jgi:hypothetical protein
MSDHLRGHRNRVFGFLLAGLLAAVHYSVTPLYVLLEARPKGFLTYLVIADGFLYPPYPWVADVVVSQQVIDRPL